MADQLTDDSPMPWGQYKGTKMANLEARYLLWIRDNMKRSSGTKHVFDYIDDNLEILKKECSQTTKEEF